jgi:hypothetical protein
MSSTSNESATNTAPENPPGTTAGDAGSQPATSTSPAENGGSQPATSTSSATNSPPVAKLEDADLESYLLLRESIRLFEWVALEHYSQGANVADRLQRAKNLIKSVTSVKEGLIDDGCGPGSRPTASGGCEDGATATVSK